LATHVHLDHAGGAGPLAQACPNATVAVHERGAKHLIKPAYLVRSVREATGPMFHHYGEAVPIPRERLLELEGGEVISLGGGFKIRVLATPGHAPHHLCFFEERNRALFVGDAAGIYWPKADRLLPTTPPPSFDLELSLRSLELLQGLGAKQLLYTHFGPHDRPVAMLRDYSRLLRAWVEEILKLKRGHKSDEAIKQSLLEKYGPLLEGYYEPEMVAHEIGMNAEGVLQYLGSSGRASKIWVWAQALSLSQVFHEGKSMASRWETGSLSARAVVLGPSNSFPRFQPQGATGGQLDSVKDLR
jgi:glyoxylase-like metal-dependent hydrolase (beta-lactamase superfamily II)